VLPHNIDIVMRQRITATSLHPVYNSLATVKLGCFLISTSNHFISMSVFRARLFYIITDVGRILLQTCSLEGMSRDSLALVVGKWKEHVFAPSTPLFFSASQQRQGLSPRWWS